MQCQSELAHLFFLGTVFLRPISLDDGVMENLFQHPKLSDVHITGTRISDAAIQILGGCPSMEMVILAQCSSYLAQVVGGS